MNYTENYSLPQWEDTDRVTREDINGAMSAIDAALAAAGGNCKIVTGNYHGNGKNYVRLSFDGKPVFVIVRPYQIPTETDDMTLIGAYNARWACVSFSGTKSVQPLSWDSTSLYWENSNTTKGFNNSALDYSYFALLKTDE